MKGICGVCGDRLAIKDAKGLCVYCARTQLSAKVKDLEAELETARAEALRRESEEATVLPEDTSLADHVRALTTRAERAEGELETEQGENERFRGIEDEVFGLRNEIEEAEHERDKSLAELEKLRAGIEQIEWVEWHGCATGDCPHDNVQDCATALGEALAEVSADVRTLPGKGNDGAKGVCGCRPPVPGECRRCSECVGEEHHWLESGLELVDRINDESEPVNECKHCPAVRRAWCDCGESSPCRCDVLSVPT